MSYPHKSGCQKRKERVEREEKFLKSQKGQSTLTAFKFCAKEKHTQATQNIEMKNQILSNDSENKKNILINDNNVTNSLTKNLIYPVLTDSIEKNLAVEESDTVVVDCSGKPECLLEVNDNTICTEKQ